MCTDPTNANNADRIVDYRNQPIAITVYVEHAARALKDAGLWILVLNVVWGGPARILGLRKPGIDRPDCVRVLSAKSLEDFSPNYSHYRQVPKNVKSESISPQGNLCGEDSMSGQVCQAAGELPASQDSKPANALICNNIFDLPPTRFDRSATVARVSQPSTQRYGGLGGDICRGTQADIKWADILPLVLRQVESGPSIGAPDRRTEKGLRVAVALVSLGAGGLQAGVVCPLLRVANLEVQPDGGGLFVNGKWRKRQVPIPKPRAAMVSSYKRSHSGDQEPGVPLSTAGSAGDRRLAVASAESLVRQTANTAANHSQILYALRHPAASPVFHTGEPLLRLGDQLGHKNLTTISRHLSVESARHNNARGLPKDA